MARNHGYGQRIRIEPENTSRPKSLPRAEDGMNLASNMCTSILMLLPLAAIGQSSDTQAPEAHSTRTKVVLLGTGTPVPDPDRSGPATAIVVDGSAYLVDFGPGVVRRAEAAMFDKGIPAREPRNRTVAFATHLHSDHTVGYPDLI